MGKREQIGAVWVKKTKNGEQYLTFTVKLDGQEHSLIAFKNRWKKNETQPSFLIFTHRPFRQDETGDIDEEEI